MEFLMFAFFGSSLWAWRPNEGVRDFGWYWGSDVQSSEADIVVLWIMWRKKSKRMMERRIREKVQFRFRDLSAVDKRSSNTFDFELMDVYQWIVKTIDYKNVNEPQHRQNSRKFNNSSIAVALIEKWKIL